MSERSVVRTRRGVLRSLGAGAVAGWGLTAGATGRWSTDGRVVDRSAADGAGVAARSARTEEPQVRWTTPLDGSGADNVRTDGERVYVERADVVTAYDAADGSRLWRSPPSLDERNQVMHLHDGVVYRSLLDTVEALEGTDGSRRWSVRTEGPVTGFDVAAGHALVGDGGGTVTAVRPADGTTAWRHDGPGGWVAPVGAAAGTVVCMRAEEAVFALDAADGTVAWRADVPTTFPLVHGDAVYTGTGDGRVVALDAATGERRWTFDTEEGKRTISYPTDGGVLATVEGAVYGLDGDGTRRWRTVVHESSAVPSFPVTVGGDSAYVNTRGRIDVLGLADGRRRWEFDAGGDYPAIAFHRGAPYVAAAGSVTALRPDGRERWSYAVGGGGTDATVADGVLYVAGDVVAALDANARPEPSFEVRPRRPAAGRYVGFDATATSDPDGTVTRYRWSFGDGTGATGERVVHRYDSPGRREVTLSVTDDRGATATAERTVRVVEAATATATSGESTSPPVPGPGPLGALGAVGAAAWRLAVGRGDRGRTEKRGGPSESGGRQESGGR